MATNKVFLDASFVLELIFKRAKYDECFGILNQLDQAVYISPLTVHLLFYFGKKEGFSFLECQTFVSQFNILNLDSDSIDEAIEIKKDDDFEDALQVACAVLNGCDLVYTLDKKFATRYQSIVDIKFV